MEHMRVLYIEPAANDAQVVLDGLAAPKVHEEFGLSFQVRWVRTVAEGLEELHRGGIDIMLVPSHLPDSPELDALPVLRSATPTLPIVVLVALHESALAAHALQMGAQSYCVKDSLDGRLLAHTLVTTVLTLRAARVHPRIVEWFHPHAVRLRHGQRMETLGRLAGRMTHELNNLFTSIIGYSDLLLMSLEPESPQHRYSQQIADVASRSSELAQHLLAFSRQQFNTSQPVTWNSVVQETIQMIYPLLGKEIDLIMDIAPDVGHIGIDPALLQHALANVLVNARDAMPEGGVLRVEMAAMLLPPAEGTRYLDAPPGRYVRLTVSDTGRGMVPTVLERLFEPYFTTKTLGEGTGLGLTVVYDIVKEYSGEIEIQSQVGQGTTFHMYFRQEQ
jgi:signal transduction histidine kinase